MNSKLQIHTIPPNISSNLQFLILAENEENELIEQINSHLKEQPIKEFKIVKRGYTSGIWRKTTNTKKDNFFYMEMNSCKNISTQGFVERFDQNSQFGICITTDFKHIAAVIYSQQKIRRLMYFPKGIHSEWNYLWMGYKKVVDSIFRTFATIKILRKSEIFGDTLSIIMKFMLPTWCRRDVIMSKNILLL